MTITVFAIDDHALFLATVALVVEAMDGFELVGTAGSAEAALAGEGEAGAATGLDEADLVLVDYQLPGMSGLELARRLGEREQATWRRGRRPVVILMSSYDRETLPCSTFAWQYVDEFVPKAQLSPDALVRCWRAHIEGKAQSRDDTR